MVIDSATHTGVFSDLPTVAEAALPDFDVPRAPGGEAAGIRPD
jgi:hypothetical protein